MKKIISLTIILNLCLQCISHPYPSMFNVEIVDTLGSDDGSQSNNNDERIFVKISQNYRKISEKIKFYYNQEKSQSTSSCGYEVEIYALVDEILALMSVVLKSNKEEVCSMIVL